MAIVFVFALLFASFWVADVQTVTILAIAAGVAMIVIRRFETSFVLLYGLSLGMSYDFLLSFRPSSGNSVLPVNALDFGMALVVIASLLNFSGEKDRMALSKSIRRPYFLFAAMTLFGLFYGIVANSGSLYTYLKDFRLFFALHLSILGVAWFIRKPSHLKLLAGTLVIVAMVCAAQQIVQFLIGGAQGIRDVSLPTQGLPMAIITLTIYRHYKVSFGPRRLYPFVIAIMLFAILVSFTRSIWLMMALSYMYGMWRMGSQRRSRAIFVGGSFIAFLIVSVFIVSNLSSNGLNIQRMAQNRVQTLVQGNDFAAESRIVTSISAWGEFVKSPIWGYGIGYPIYVYDIGTRSTIEDMTLHNSPLYYGLKIGVVGLIGLVWLIVAGATSASRIAVETSEEEPTEKREIRAFAQSMLVGMIPFILIGPWSGNLNYFPFMMPLGLFIGLNWEKIMASAG